MWLRCSRAVTQHHLITAVLELAHIHHLRLVRLPQEAAELAEAEERFVEIW
jgi:hypothetical protein